MRHISPPDQLTCQCQYQYHLTCRYTPPGMTPGLQAAMDTSPAVVANTADILLEVRIVLRLYSGASRGVSVSNFSIISERITMAWETLAW